MFRIKHENLFFNGLSIQSLLGAKIGLVIEKWWRFLILIFELEIKPRCWERYLNVVF